MLASFVWASSPGRLTICWFISPGAVLCTLHQTQWQEIPTDIRWRALPAPSRVPWTSGEREGATGGVCLPPDVREVSSQVRTDERTLTDSDKSGVLPVYDSASAYTKQSNVCRMNKSRGNCEYEKPSQSEESPWVYVWWTMRKDSFCGGNVGIVVR